MQLRWENILRRSWKVEVKHECLHRHLLITAIGTHTIRMVPPLIIAEKDCDEAYEIIKASVVELTK